MERLTIRSADTHHENNVCCTHFCSPECNAVYANCAGDCPWEEAAWSKLADYEDAEEQERLVVLPCKVGDTVYWLSYNRDACRECDCYSPFCGMDRICDEHYELYPEVDPVDDAEHCPKHFIEIIEKKTTFHWILLYLKQFGKTVFLTREEAEAALKGGTP